MVVKLDALVFQRKSDGNVILSCGLAQKDLDLLANLLSALRDLSSEAISNENKEFNVTFHHFGGYFIFLLAKDDFYVGVIIQPIGLDQISEVGGIFSFASQIADVFRNVVWNNLSEDEKDLGLIPETLVFEFERAMTEFIISRGWSERIKLSERFIASRTGVTVIKTLYNILTKKLERVLGPKLTVKIFNLLRDQYRVYHKNGDLKLVRNRRVKVVLMLPEEEDKLSDALIFLAKIYFSVLNKIKDRIHNDALFSLRLFDLIAH